jgi:hypothetical protein
LKLVLFPPRKDYILFSNRKKINAGRFKFCKIKINDSITIQHKSKYFKAPTDLYKAVRSVITKANYIYFTRNQKGFNSYFFKTKFDIIITNHSGRVIDVVQYFNINTISKHYDKGYYVYFMPIGSITYYEIKKNDLINFRHDFESDYFAQKI